MDFEKVITKKVRERVVPMTKGWVPVPNSQNEDVDPRKVFPPREDIVLLNRGEVGFVSPDHVREAAKKAIDEGRTGYGYLRDLRVAITEKLKRDNNIEADPDKEILVSSGCHAIIAQVFEAIVEPGDEVIMGTPDLYYHPNTFARGGTSVFVPLREERDYHLDPDEVEAAITPQTKIIGLTTPDGPVGAVHRKEDLEKIAEMAIKHDLLVISDEIYEKINFDQVPHFSIASLPGMRERTITINGFSKGYAMTGWRIGYAVIPESFILGVQAVTSLHTIRLNTISQYAAVAAYRGPQDVVADMVAEYKRRMTILVDGINAIDGLRCKFPDGTYYAWVNSSDTGLSAEDVARHCLESEKVMFSAGVSFPGGGGKNHHRVSASLPEETIREGLERLGRAVGSL
jgi:aspartate/methionine/tyrosine aminotransferase